MKTYGYIRVSSADQSANRQLDAINKFEIPTKHIFIDKQSGKDFNRPQYKKLMKRLRAGDVLYITSIDRLSRNKADIKRELEYFRANNIRLKVLDLPTTMIDLPKEQEWVFEMVNNILIEVLGTIAEQEYTTIHKRQAEGIAAAKARGVKFGRKPKELPDNFDECVKNWKQKTLKRSELLEKCGISQSTFYRILRENRDVEPKVKKLPKGVLYGNLPA